MTGTTQSDQQLIDTYLPHILENEAKGLLQDLLVQPLEPAHHRVRVSMRNIAGLCAGSGEMQWHASGVADHISFCS